MAHEEIGRLDEVHVGRPCPATWQGDRFTTGIWKTQIDGPVAVAGVNLAGDDQADRSVHGGPDKAVYAYGAEEYRWWSHELGREVSPGTFGENLTIGGLPVSGAVVGERWRIGTVVLEVAQPRFPCFKLAMRMNDAGFPKRFTRAGLPGAYLRVVEEGTLAAGDEVRVVARPLHGVTVAEVAHIYQHRRGDAGRLLRVPALAANLRDWAARTSTRQGERSRTDTG